jgi:hypothetical protein
MEIADLLPTALVLPATGDIVHIPTQRWALERWEGEDPPELAITWSCKPKFSVGGSRSCAELAIVDHLRGDGWHGAWVNAFRGELRSQWFPAPAVKTLAEAGAPAWAVEIFGRLRAANGGTLGGFFDVFAWREPGQVRFCEAKVGPDRIKPTQLRFVEVALGFHRLEDFMIIVVAGPSLRGVPVRRPERVPVAVERDTPRPVADLLRSNGQELMRQAGRDLLSALDGVTRPDELETREMLHDIAAAIQTRRKNWPRE